MSYEPSGEQEVVVTSKTYDLISKLADVNQDRLAGYDTGYDKTGEIKNPHTTIHPASQNAIPLSFNPARRYAVSRMLAVAEKEASLMETFSEAGDVIELSNAGFRLKDALSDLWDLRKEREDDWGDLLNILQAALSQKEFERFTVEQCYVIRSVIANHLGAGTVDIDDIEDSIRLLRKAGFDPWKGISGTIEHQEQTG